MADTFVIDSTTGKASIVKDPNAVLDYVFDWTSWLDALPDTLSSHSAAIESGSGAINSSTINGKTVVVWVSGGVVGETIALRCRITTAGGRTDDRTVYIKVKER